MRAKFINESFLEDYNLTSWLDKLLPNYDSDDEVISFFINDNTPNILKDILQSPQSKYILSILINEKHINIIFPGRLIKQDICYHVTPTKNVRKILEQGLLPNKPNDLTFDVLESNTLFIPYQGIFLITRNSGIEDLQDMMEMEDYWNKDNYTILQVNTKDLNLYRDNGLIEEMDSIVMFEPIPPHRISVVKE